MIIGVPKEIKAQEYRVGLTPSAVMELTRQGHTVIIEAQAGSAIGFHDEIYKSAGANIERDAASLWSQAQLIIKVKEPLPQEYGYFRENLLIFTFLHLAAEPSLTKALTQSSVTGIAYETVSNPQGQLPLLAPMSEIAGRFAIQAAARCMECSQAGQGLLLGGVPGVTPANILILGGGIVGLNAARMAIGLGAQVTIVDRSLPRLRYIDELYAGRINTIYANRFALEEQLPHSNVVVGAVLLPGASAPKLLSQKDLSLLQDKSVLVDVAIDQGGCFATSRPTTHAEPTFNVDGIIHYCVTNIPGAVAKTATQALSNATLPYALKLANEGSAAFKDLGLRDGLNTYQGHVTHAAVAESLSLPCKVASDFNFDA